MDGPLGTELDARGVPTDDLAWSAHAIDSAPDVIAAIHRDYVAAGATIHTANTFRTKRRSVSTQWCRMATAAVRLAKASVPQSHRVAGSIAPLEDCYQPWLSPGAGSRGEHRELAEALASAGCDILLCETFAHLGEAIVAVEESVRTGIETWVALTAGPNADLMTTGQMSAAARRAVDAGATAVCVNCTPTDQTLRFVEAIANLKPDFLIGAYSNAGMRSWQSTADDAVNAYVNEARRWISAGATIIGGCCGTTPTHIAKLRALIDEI